MGSWDTPGWQNTWRHWECLGCWLLWMKKGLSPREGCSPRDAIHIWEVAGQTPGTETLNSPGDRFQCAMEVIFVTLTQACIWTLTLGWANKYFLLRKWHCTLVVIVEAQSWACAHTDKAGEETPSYCCSCPWPPKWEWWSSHIHHPPRLFIAFMHLFENICKTPVCPLALPTSSWFGHCYFPVFRNMCSNTLGSVCGPGGDRVAFQYQNPVRTDTNIFS